MFAGGASNTPANTVRRPVGTMAPHANQSADPLATRPTSGMNPALGAVGGNRPTGPLVPPATAGPVRPPGPGRIHGGGAPSGNETANDGGTAERPDAAQDEAPGISLPPLDPDLNRDKVWRYARSLNGSVRAVTDENEIGGWASYGRSFGVAADRYFESHGWDFPAIIFFTRLYDLCENKNQFVKNVFNSSGLVMKDIAYIYDMLYEDDELRDLVL